MPLVIAGSGSVRQQSGLDNGSKKNLGTVRVSRPGVLRLAVGLVVILCLVLFQLIAVGPGSGKGGIGIGRSGSSFVDVYEVTGRRAKVGGTGKELYENDVDDDNIRGDDDNDDGTGGDAANDNTADENGVDGTTTEINGEKEVKNHIDDGSISERLVVEINHRAMFWGYGQSRLCQILYKMTNTETLGTTSSSLSPRPLLNATINCLWLKTREGLGQGNWITAIYQVRMAAALAQVDFLFQCTDRRNSQMSLLLPWFDEYQKAPIELDPWPYGATVPTDPEACTDKYPYLRIDKMINQIVDDTRKMAVTLVGSQENPLRTHRDIPRNQEPLIPNVILDDVVIHFRCGDVMGGADRGDFGMIKYNSYKRINRNETKSLGIVTQPFDKGLNRRTDMGKVDSCRQAVYLLIDYLHEHVIDQDVPIWIHNGPNETLPLTYARLVMAKQAFTSLSTFGIFPVLGTFGQGYFQEGNYGVNPFANYLPLHMSNMHKMTGPRLGTGTIQKMELKDVLDWFVTD